MKHVFIILFTILVIAGLVLTNTYMQKYNQDSKTTATSGWFFKTTLNLSEYKNVSSGNDLWGSFERYSRSDRHTETISVYCNKYCKN